MRRSRAGVGLGRGMRSPRGSKDSYHWYDSSYKKGTLRGNSEEWVIYCTSAGLLGALLTARALAGREWLFEGASAGVPGL